MILAIDPGPEQSAWLLLDDAGMPVRFAIEHNPTVLARMYSRDFPSAMLVVEQVAGFGMPVGAEVFETVFWSGRFIEAWVGRWGPSNEMEVDGAFDRIKRHEIKGHLCRNVSAKDANIRQALIDRFGPGKAKAVGLKKTPGPLYGVANDVWSALAVAVTAYDKWKEDPIHGKG